jgi:hypothetical protein
MAEAVGLRGRVEAVDNLDRPGKPLSGREEVEQLVEQWPGALRQFWKAKLKEKLKAVYLLLTGRAPYLINHAAQEIIFMAFEGLPLQGYD